MAESLLERGLVRLFRFVNRFTTWDKLPLPLALANLDALRIELRRDNLHDTSQGELKNALEGSGDARHRVARMADGSYNDLEDPQMGAVGMRFGRNFPLARSFPETGEALMTPNPRVVSRKLMTREAFQPATTLNVVAAAWIQFMVHGWVFHDEDPDPAKGFRVPLEKGDPWSDPEMRIRRTLPDPTRLEDSQDPPSFRNHVTHWWDASQLYGSSRAELDRLRAKKDGKLLIQEDRRLPIDPVWGVDLTGFNKNYWVGLSLLHTLFALEHNAICDRLRDVYPDWSDQELFDTARLVNAALLAKIHTVEWTPAILGHPALQIAMHANWWGLATERITRVLGRFGDGELVSGIPGSPADHHGAFFSMTEEFTAVYRLHSLIPDHFAFCSAADGRLLFEQDLHGVSDQRGRTLLDQKLSMEDGFYSLGIAHPGALTLHNYPRGLQDLHKPDGEHVDLATIDILRDRERGVPRYNDFRELLRKPRLTRFDQLTRNPQWARELEEVYAGDIDRVDTMVGLMAEEPPAGFGFSDTAFRIFILMASRRLKSDRFFCEDYTPEIYTQAGLDWIAENDMSSVLLRHFPALKPALHAVRNAFAPWHPVATTQ